MTIESYTELMSKVSKCKKCNRMFEREPVLNENNGNIHTDIMFIAEAPGRFGADKYKIPLWGDATGKNFEAFIGYIGLKRDSIFITNAVLCNPRNQDGKNSSPNISEIKNCSKWLEMQIEIVNPLLIVTLGSKALLSLNMISKHNVVNLKDHVAKCINWNGRYLIPLYHPSPLAMANRNKNIQIDDYVYLRSEIEKRHIKCELEEITDNYLKQVYKRHEIYFKK